ncbi:MAG: flagellin FliC [Bdellovibrionales bacterium]|nr:flagellin FliC [Bdellovibrionales bacterium]
MSLRISSYIPSLAAQRSLSKTQRQIERSQIALASGKRIVSSADDAAGFAISESLRGQISGTRQGKENAENAVSLIQTAEGGLAEQNNILVRLRELAVYAASDTIGDDEREFLDMEYQQLTQELDRIAKTTTFGAKKLLEGTGEEFEFQVGANRGANNVISFKLESDTTSDSLGIDGLSISDQDDALDNLEELDTALVTVAEARATFGAMQSRFQYAIDHAALQADNLETARSRITDVDVAKEVSNLVTNQIRQEAGIAVMAGAKQDAQRVLQLI